MTERKKRKEVTPEDVDYIRKYSQSKKDKEIAEVLGFSVALIRKVRNDLGIRKNNTAKNEDIKEINEKVDRSDMTVVNDIDMHGKSEDKIKAHFEALFKNSIQYQMLKEMYTGMEVEYYLQELSAHISDVKSMGETINASELRSLDQLIQNKVRMNRLVKEETNIKICIEGIVKRVRYDETKLEEEETSKVFMFRKNIEKSNKDWKDLNETSIKLSQMLDVTRQERVKRSAAGENGILKIVKDLQDKTKREVVEKQSAMIEKSVNNLEKEWKEIKHIINDENIDEVNIDEK